MLLAALAGFIGLTAACGGDSEEAATPTASQEPTKATEPTATAEAAEPTSAPTQAPTPESYVILTAEPDSGYVGTEFTVTGEGLPPNTEGELIWGTYDGSYDMDVTVENVLFLAKKYDPTRVSMGKVSIDADGKFSIKVTAPEDYGELHDVFVSIDGEDVAKGGFRIKRLITISPESGPIGTPITITATGLGYKPYESIVALRYDNNPTGIVTAITTRGTAVATIRASGKAGKHVLDLNHGARSVPYLNNQQAGTAHIPDFRLWFTITDDTVMPPDSIEWPNDDYLAKSADIETITTRTLTDSNIGDAAFEPVSGPILSSTILKAAGLEANAEVELFWVTARGNRVSATGWSLAEKSLGTFTADGSGNLEATVEVPDDLGGWHVVKIASKEEILAEVPFFVEHSIVGITPRQVKAGDVIEIQVKGIGWTELDNGVAIVYDNSYLGFACGFNSVGDVTVYLVATGEPGVHLVSFYPMIYQGHGEPPWGYQQAILTFAQDAPGLQLGYRLPVLHMAFEIVE
jgi:hypothetical protein